MDALNVRVLEILNSSTKNKTLLAQSLGVSAAQLSHIYSGRNKPGVELLQKLISLFPTISAHWLLTGEGNMHIKNTGDRLVILETLLDKTLQRLQSAHNLNREMEQTIREVLKSC